MYGHMIKTYIQLARLRWWCTFLLTHLTPLSPTCKNILKKLWKFIFWGLLPTPSPVFSTQRTVLSAVPATVSVWFHTANDLLYSLQGHVTTASEKAHSTHTMPYTHRQATEIIFLWYNFTDIYYFGLICQASLIQWQCLKIEKHEESDSQRF